MKIITNKMEINWDKITLPEELINSPLFNSIAISSLIEIWPDKNISLDWGNYYDNWHRHLIPLSSFLMPVHEAISLYGLPYFSPCEDPMAIKESYDNAINSYNTEKIKLENDILFVKNQIENSTDDYQITDLNDKLSDLNIHLKFLSKPKDQVKYIIRDLEDRQALMKAAKNKYDVRWYMLLHHCWSNAKMIYLILSNISPEYKWNVIVSRSHALVTNGNRNDLDNYLNGIISRDFYIADPVLSTWGNFKENARNLMPDPETWKIISDEAEIYKTDFSTLCN